MISSYSLISKFPVPLPVIQGLFPVYQLHLVSLSPSCSIVFLFFFSSLARSRYLSLFSLSSNFILWSTGMAKSTIFLLIITCLVVWPRSRDLFLSQNSRELCEVHSLGRIEDCEYTTCSFGQISISCTIPSGLPSPFSLVESYRFLC